MKLFSLIIFLLFLPLIQTRRYSYSNSGYKMYYERGYPKYVHRENYKKYYGNIPKNYEIHHIDKNKYNNHPSNLVALSRRQHRKIHNKL